jgi:hypothetical protein
MKSVFLANLHHAYAQTDGSYAFPNSREGDMLKTAKREIEALHAERDLAQKFYRVAVAERDHARLLANPAGQPRPKDVGL